MSDASFVFVVVTSAFLMAGLVKGIIGLGLPTLAMGLLSLAMPPAEAAGIVVIPSVITNVWQMLAGPGMKLRAKSDFLAPGSAAARD